MDVVIGTRLGLGEAIRMLTSTPAAAARLGGCVFAAI